MGELEKALEEARELREGFEVDESKDFEWVYQYAVDRYRLVFDTNEIIDRKAESNLRLTLVGVGLLLTLGIKVVPELSGSTVLVLMVIVGVALWAATLFFLARSPEDFTVPPEAGLAIQLANSEKKSHAMAGMALVLNQATEAAAIDVAVKSDQVKRGLWWLKLSLWLMLLPPFMSLNGCYEKKQPDDKGSPTSCVRTSVSRSGRD